MSRLFCCVALATAVALVVGCAESEAVENEGAATKILNQPAAEDGTTTQANSDESPERSVAVGEPAPAWEGLTGIDGKKHSLKDLDDAEAVAVVFTCNRCPVAVAYEERLVELVGDYEDKGVRLVAINVNRGDAEELDAMKKRAEQSGFTFAYLKDPSQEIGRAYGATVTPHAFVLDKDRNVVYMGAIDDSQDKSKIKHHHLRDAIDAVLAGDQPEVDTTKQFGCGISYE